MELPIRQSARKNGGKLVAKPNDIVDAEFEIVNGDNAQITNPQPVRREAPPVTPVRHDADRIQLGAFGDAAQPQKAERMSVAMFATVTMLCSFAAFSIGAAYAYFATPAGPGLPIAFERVASERAELELVTTSVAHQDVFGGLLLHDLSFEKGVSNGREYMSVEGVVVNEGDQPLIIPALRLLFGPDGEPKARYRIDRGETLKPGEQIAFTSRIPLRDTDPIRPKLEFIR